MNEDDNKVFYKQKHQINIALASQMMILDSLNRIAQLNFRYPIDSPEKQKAYLDSVIQHLIIVTPYLSLTDSKEYSDKLLNFQITRKAIIKNRTQKINYSFDPELDKKLNKILIELQQKLRPIFTKVKDDEEEGL